MQGPGPPVGVQQAGSPSDVWIEVASDPDGTLVRVIANTKDVRVGLQDVAMLFDELGIHIVAYTTERDPGEASSSTSFSSQPPSVERSSAGRRPAATTYRGRFVVTREDGGFLSNAQVQEMQELLYRSLRSRLVAAPSIRKHGSGLTPLFVMDRRSSAAMSEGESVLSCNSNLSSDPGRNSQVMDMQAVNSLSNSFVLAPSHAQQQQQQQQQALQQTQEEPGQQQQPPSHTLLQLQPQHPHRLSSAVQHQQSADMNVSVACRTLSLNPTCDLSTRPTATLNDAHVHFSPHCVIASSSKQSSENQVCLDHQHSNLSSASHSMQQVYAQRSPSRQDSSASPSRADSAILATALGLSLASVLDQPMFGAGLDDEIEAWRPQTGWPPALNPALLAHSKAAAGARMQKTVAAGWDAACDEDDGFGSFYRQALGEAQPPASSAAAAAVTAAGGEWLMRSNGIGYNLMSSGGEGASENESDDSDWWGALSSTDTVGKVMSSPVISIKADADLLTAKSEMAHHDISCLLVDTGTAEPGFITKRDLIKVTSSRKMKRAKVRDIMTQPVLSVSVDMPLQQCSAFLETHRVRRVMVIDPLKTLAHAGGGHLAQFVGVISEKDIFKRLNKPDPSAIHVRSPGNSSGSMASRADSRASSTPHGNSAAQQQSLLGTRANSTAGMAPSTSTTSMAPNSHGPDTAGHDQAHTDAVSERYRAAAALWELDYSELELIRKIGEGSFGEVLLGSFRGTKVAIKKMLGFEQSGPLALDEPPLNDGADTPVFKSFFDREIEILATIRHPNVVNFIGACHTPPNVCLVTEYCARGSLDHLLHKTSVPVDLVKKVEFALDIARGMSCLHAQKPIIIHRDLKTANLLVSARFEVKVADFGLSRIKDHAQLTNSRGGLEGTVEYCAPEVLRGEPYSEKCDIWSYGVVMWELLHRTRPYADTDVPLYILVMSLGNGTLRLPPVREDTSTPGLSRLLERCMSWTAQERPSFREILHFLELEYKSVRAKATAHREPGSAPTPTPSSAQVTIHSDSGMPASEPAQEDQSANDPFSRHAAAAAAAAAAGRAVDPTSPLGYSDNSPLQSPQHSNATAGFSVTRSEQQMVSPYFRTSDSSGNKGQQAANVRAAQNQAAGRVRAALISGVMANSRPLPGHGGSLSRPRSGRASRAKSMPLPAHLWFTPPEEEDESFEGSSRMDSEASTTMSELMVMQATGGSHATPDVHSNCMTETESDHSSALDLGAALASPSLRCVNRNVSSFMGPERMAAKAAAAAQGVSIGVSFAPDTHDPSTPTATSGSEALQRRSSPAAPMQSMASMESSAGGSVDGSTPNGDRGSSSYFSRTHDDLAAAKHGGATAHVNSPHVRQSSPQLTLPGSPFAFASGGGGHSSPFANASASTRHLSPFATVASSELTSREPSPSTSPTISSSGVAGPVSSVGPLAATSSPFSRPRAAGTAAARAAHLASSSTAPAQSASTFTSHHAPQLHSPFRQHAPAGTDLVHPRGEGNTPLNSNASSLSPVYSRESLRSPFDNMEGFGAAMGSCQPSVASSGSTALRSPFDNTPTTSTTGSMVLPPGVTISNSLRSPFDSIQTVAATVSTSGSAQLHSPFENAPSAGAPAQSSSSARNPSDNMPATASRSGHLRSPFDSVPGVAASNSQLRSPFDNVPAVASSSSQLRSPFDNVPAPQDLPVVHVKVSADASSSTASGLRSPFDNVPSVTSVNSQLRSPFDNLPPPGTQPAGSTTHQSSVVQSASNQARPSSSQLRSPFDNLPPAAPSSSQLRSPFDNLTPAPPAPSASSNQLRSPFDNLPPVPPANGGQLHSPFDNVPEPVSSSGSSGLRSPFDNMPARHSSSGLRSPFDNVPAPTSSTAAALSSPFSNAHTASAMTSGSCQLRSPFDNALPPPAALSTAPRNSSSNLCSPFDNTAGPAINSPTCPSQFPSNRMPSANHSTAATCMAGSSGIRASNGNLSDISFTTATSRSLSGGFSPSAGDSLSSCPQALPQASGLTSQVEGHSTFATVHNSSAPVTSTTSLRSPFDNTAVSMGPSPSASVTAGVGGSQPLPLPQSSTSGAADFSVSSLGSLFSALTSRESSAFTALDVASAASMAAAANASAAAQRLLGTLASSPASGPMMVGSMADVLCGDGSSSGGTATGGELDSACNWSLIDSLSFMLPVAPHTPVKADGSGGSPRSLGLNFDVGHAHTQAAGSGQCSRFAEADDELAESPAPSSPSLRVLVVPPAHITTHSTQDAGGGGGDGGGSHRSSEAHASMGNLSSQAGLLTPHSASGNANTTLSPYAVYQAYVESLKDGPLDLDAVIARTRSGGSNGFGGGSSAGRTSATGSHTGGIGSAGRGEGLRRSTESDRSTTVELSPGQHQQHHAALSEAKHDSSLNSSGVFGVHNPPAHLDSVSAYAAPHATAAGTHAPISGFGLSDNSVGAENDDSGRHMHHLMANNEMDVFSDEDLFGEGGQGARMADELLDSSLHSTTWVTL